MRRRALTRPSWRARERSCALIAVSEKQKPRLDGCGALLAARSEAVSVNRHGPAGAREPCSVDRRDEQGGHKGSPSCGRCRGRLQQQGANDAGGDASAQGEWASCVAARQRGARGWTRATYQSTLSGGGKALEDFLISGGSAKAATTTRALKRPTKIKVEPVAEAQAAADKRAAAKKPSGRKLRPQAGGTGRCEMRKHERPAPQGMSARGAAIAVSGGWDVSSRSRQRCRH
jgi:hypothetical protein